MSNRNFARMSDPGANGQFSRRWKFVRPDQFANLPAIESQAARDAEARHRLGLPVPRTSAAIFAEAFA